MNNFKHAFTLRGHQIGVTALTDWRLASSDVHLISGDEEGSIVIWNLATFRQVIKLPHICHSRVQSLRVIKLKIEENYTDILVAQSRDDGVYLLKLEPQMKADIQPLKNFPTYESLFSRGDAKSIDQNRSVLAYPSEIDSDLVTLRFIGSDAKTLLAGSAKRCVETNPMKKTNIFDIRLCDNLKDAEQLFLYVAYEDGCICKFGFNFDSVITVPVLNCTGLKIDLIQKFDLNIMDFVSAFDVMETKQSTRLIIGSPARELIVLDVPLIKSGPAKPSISKVPLKQRGVSTITMSQDFKFVAIACWDNTVHIYSIGTLKHLVTLTNHSKQVQAMVFVTATNSDCPKDYDAGDNDDNHECGDGAKNETNFLFCCASMEGTISVSSIY